MRLLKLALTSLASLAALGVAAVAGVQIAGHYFGGASAVASAPAGAMMAMPVPVVSVVKKTLPIYLDYPGRIESIRNIALQARVSGYIESQLAPDGADVKTGDLLYEIDPRDLHAAFDLANAQAQRDQASLEYARANFGRGEELVKSGFVKDAYDQRASAMHQAEAALVADRAAIETAKLNLSYAEITAPFSGRLGRNQAARGALVGSATGPLNTLVQLDPIYVAFNPSESDLPEIAAARASGKVDAEISLAGKPDAVRKGDLTFLDNVVDKATGTIAARVTIANRDFALLPGQYVRVRLHIRDEPDAVMAPQTALGSNQMGRFVYVVGAGDKAELRLLTLGAMDGDLVSVVKGLSEGERIIVGNLQKIGPGSPVKPLPQEQAANP
jgi:multidrug efflux system membrane fusion protein